MKTPCGLDIHESQSCQKLECDKFTECIELWKDDLLFNLQSKGNTHLQSTQSQNSNTIKDGSE